MSDEIKKTCEWCDGFDSEALCLETDKPTTKDSTCKEWTNDEVKKCDLCEKLQENPSTCGRCERAFCDEHSGYDNIPYTTAEDYCSECGDEFQNLWSAFTCGSEIHMDAIPSKEKKEGGPK